MPRVRYDPAVAWKVVFVAMGMATVVAVGLPAAATTFAAAGAPNAGPVLRRRRSAHGWLLREREVVREFKRAGVRIGRKYVRSCMRCYLEGGDPSYTRDAARVSHLDKRSVVKFGGCASQVD
jgi:hypothetical protein